MRERFSLTLGWCFGSGQITLDILHCRPYIAPGSTHEQLRSAGRKRSKRGEDFWNCSSSLCAIYVIFLNLPKTVCSTWQSSLLLLYFGKLNKFRMWIIRLRTRDWHAVGIRWWRWRWRRSRMWRRTKNSWETTAWCDCCTLNNSVSQPRGQFIFFIFRLSCCAQVDVSVSQSASSSASSLSKQTNRNNNARFGPSPSRTCRT